MLEGIYQFLDNLFGSHIAQHPLLAITIAGFVIGGSYNLLYYFFTDIEKTRKLQKMAQELQMEMKEAQKSGDEKKLRKIQQKQMNLMKMH